MLNRTVLGACEKTTWDRSCSLWVGLHALAARADATDTSKAFMDLTFRLLSGGATQCAARAARAASNTAPRFKKENGRRGIENGT